MKLTRALGWIAGALALGGAAFVALTAASWSAGAASDVPTARVVRGALRLDVHATGEMRAGRSASLSGPPVGGMLRLVRLADTGAAVRAGDIVMEFDPADQQHALEQSRSELLEAEQEIVKMRADAAVQAAQDQVERLTARFDVRRAELDALADADLLGAIEAKKRQLAIEEARRRLAQLQEDVRSRADTSRAALAVVEEKRTKARLATERARQIIESLAVRAPIDGLVAIKENRDAAGGFFFSGMTLPEYRAGDTVGSGRVVMDIFDTSRLEIRAKVNEQDRANVNAGQTAVVQADALPGRPLSAKVASLSGLASRGFFFDSAGPLRQFDAMLQLDPTSRPPRPGTSVRIRVAGPEVRDALYVPRQALFQKNGKPVVYVRAGERFEPREVKVTHRTESRVAIEGVADGTEVALVNPEAPATTPAAARGPVAAARLP
jgi:multidrug resistance efflux pump